MAYFGIALSQTKFVDYEACMIVAASLVLKESALMTLPWGEA